MTNRSRPSSAEWVAALLIIAALTAITRASAFGNPVYQVDDQFYLHVGQAILRGELPYVDVIDRKPPGLFLIYALISLTGGDGVAVYQIAAGLFVLATALVIWRFGHLLSTLLGGLAAAAAYLVTLPIFGGAGGQAPVFYNLPIVLAAYWTFQTLRSPAPDWRPFSAMAMAGLAITIKTVAVVEGVFFGLALLEARRRETGLNAALAVYALKLIAIAIAPMAMFLVIYAGLGHAREFWFANFVSIFLKTNISNATSWLGLGRLGIYLFPLIMTAFAGTVFRALKSRRLEFVDGWMLAAILGFLAVPNFYSHYLLPLLVPLAVSSASFMARPVPAVAGLSLIGMISWLNINIRDIETPQAKRQYATLVDQIDKASGPDRTLFVFDGPPLLYRSTGIHPLSPIVFPDHFVSARERAALGVDPDRELRRILDCRPSVIVTDALNARDPNQATHAMVSDALARHYTVAAQVPLTAERFHNVITVWARRPGSEPDYNCLPE